MSNALYDLGRESYLNGGIDMTTDAIKVAAVTSGYTPNLSTDQFLSDVPSGDIVITSSALTSKTTTDGTFDAADVTLSSVTGSAIAALVIYQDTGTDSTSQLIAYIDTATGLPVTPNGGNIDIDWDNGTNKIFTL